MQIVTPFIKPCLGRHVKHRSRLGNTQSTWVGQCSPRPPRRLHPAVISWKVGKGRPNILARHLQIRRRLRNHQPGLRITNQSLLTGYGMFRCEHDRLAFHFTDQFCAWLESQSRASLFREDDLSLGGYPYRHSLPFYCILRKSSGRIRSDRLIQ